MKGTEKRMNLKNEIKKLGSLSELNELSSFVEDCKTMLGKMSLSIGAKVWVVQKTKKTEGVITKINQSLEGEKNTGAHYDVADVIADYNKNEFVC